MLTIDADNVTLRNFHLSGTAGLYGIKINDGHSGIVIEDGEITGGDTGILGVGYTGRHLYVHDTTGDGFKTQGVGGPTLLEYNFVEKLGTGSRAHADANQMIGGANVTMRYNNFWIPATGPNYPGAPYSSNACFIAETTTTITNVLVEDNWLNGGNFTIYCGSGGVSVRNNRFGRDYRFGVNYHSGVCDEWSGNIWDETEEKVTGREMK